MSDDTETTLYVYFAQVRGGGPVKIGCSYGPKKRIASLQSWCPFPLDFVAMFEADVYEERVLHEAQKDFCIHGEWFEPNEALSALIAHVIEHECLPATLQDDADRRREIWWAEEQVRRAESAEWWERARRGEVKPQQPSERGRADGWNKNPESLRRFREKRAASDARRKAAKGTGRQFDFKVVAAPKSPN